METQYENPDTHAGRVGNSASVVLLVLLCMIILISTVFVIGAYYNYKEHTHKIETTLDAIRTNIIEDAEGDADVERKNKCFLRYLEEISKSATEGGNISFLFTIFSIALVSGGAYLLERSRQTIEDADQKVRKAENLVGKLRNKAEAAEKTVERTQKKAKTAADIFEDGQTISRVSSTLYRAEHYSFELRQLKKGNEFDDLVVRERDSVKEVHDDLQDVELRGKRLNAVQSHHFRNTIDMIRANIESLPPGSRKKVEDIIERCGRIIELLRNVSRPERRGTRSKEQHGQLDDRA